MTSTQIERRMLSLHDDTTLDVELEKVTAMLEIAYQLARLNEREEVKNPMSRLCECGHTFGQHAQVRTDKGIATCCYAGNCPCRREM